MAAALALSRDSFTLARGSSIFALCRASDEANHLMEELAQRFPDATLVIRVALPVTRATLALQRGEAQGAIMLLEPVRPYDHSPFAVFWPAYIRGQAYLQIESGAGRSGAIPEHPRSSWW